MDYLKELEKNLSSILENFKQNIASIRSNRVTPQIIENIEVNCYNSSLPIKQLGVLSVNPPREIIINLWDKSLLKSVTSAISNTKRFTVNDDGNIIRVVFPPLSQETRLELTKEVIKESEQAKIKIRQLRDDLNKHVKDDEKAGLINEDEKFNFLKKIQEKIDESNKTIEKLVEEKNKELME